MPRPPVRALLIDLSGTLHIGPKPTPSAVESLQRLRREGIPVRFCSNTSKESSKDLRARLCNIGFDVNDGELWTSLGALRDVVRAKGLKRPYFLLSDSALEEFNDFPPTHGSAGLHHSTYDSVIIGLAPKLFNYDSLTKAFRILISGRDSGPKADEGAGDGSSAPSLIATHKAKYIRTPDNELSLGPGPFVAALEDAIGDTARTEVVGKPSRTFFERVLDSLRGELDATRTGETEQDERQVNGERGVTPRNWQDVVIIGDDVQADLGEGAIELNLWRVLVKTGKYRPGDESRPGVHPPDEVHDSFASFVDDFLRGTASQSLEATSANN